MPGRSWFIVIGILPLLLLGMGRVGPEGEERDQPPSGQGPSVPERIEGTGIENLYRLGPRLYSGAQPEGRAGFEALARLGVRTIITVDGARPDVETARSLGLRYVHLPVGYDGIPRDQAVRLIRAAQGLPGPVFVHCHHGKHRGPAAAALCGMAIEGWDREQARAWLETAGTDPTYRGLFATVDRFVVPSAEELARGRPDDLPEQAEVPDLVGAMVLIDGRWDHLKAIAEAGFRPPAASPDLDPPHEALMLAELFREATRDEAARSRGPEFVRLLADAEGSASALAEALRESGGASSPALRRKTETAFTAAGRSCSACHARFRDNRDRR